MTSQGSAHGRFQRAVSRRHLLPALAAARELGELALADALALCVLLAEQDSPLFPRAAVRWHGRFELEANGVTLGEAQLALAALEALRDPSTARPAGSVLRDLVAARGLGNVPLPAPDRTASSSGALP